MDERLLARLSAMTEEEERIVRGEPLSRDTYTSRAAFVISGSTFLPPRRMITLRPHTRFTAFPPHSHDYVEMLYMLSGETVHELPGSRVIRLRAGELLLINCQAVHAIRRCESGDVGVNFIVLPSFFDEALEVVGPSNALGQFLIGALKRGQSSVPYLHFRVADQPAIQSVLESMVYSLASDAPTGQRVLKTSMTLLFLYLMENTARLSTPMRRGDALVVAVLDEIRHRYADLSLREIADARHVSAAYLSQTVRKATGRSCTQLIQLQRMAQAKRLLRETDMSVAEICAAVGYANTGHFYRLFAQMTGMSPGTYRDVNTGR